MKCKKCGSKMKLTDKVEMEGRPTYESYRCTNLECFDCVETLDGKIIGEEVEIMFYPKMKGE